MGNCCGGPAAKDTKKDGDQADGKMNNPEKSKKPANQGKSAKKTAAEKPAKKEPPMTNLALKSANDYKTVNALPQQKKPQGNKNLPAPKGQQAAKCK